MESKAAFAVESESAISDHQVVFNIVKVYGQIEFTDRKRGKIFGGVTWVPDGRLPIAVPVKGEEVLTVEQAVELFKDLLETLMPAEMLLDKVPDDDF